MRERNDWILSDMIETRVEQKPDLDVLTFEHLSLDGGATPDEVRTYAELYTNAQRIAAAGSASALRCMSTRTAGSTAGAGAAALSQASAAGGSLLSQR